MVAAMALACTALISACGSSSLTRAKTNVNTPQVALAIEQSILTKRHLHATVSCPPTVPAEKGKTFVCIATVASAKKPPTLTKTPFTVTVQSDRGFVTYVGAGP